MMGVGKADLVYSSFIDFEASRGLPRKQGAGATLFPTTSGGFDFKQN